MSDVLTRLKLLRGEAVRKPVPEVPADYAEAARQLAATVRTTDSGVHFLLEQQYGTAARHGDVPLEAGDPHPLLLQHAGVPELEGPVVYLDTETTGLAGGAGTFAFLIGVGHHATAGFTVRQHFLPGPQHERAQLEALAASVADAGMVVTYNGSSFDLPLLRTRFALNGMQDPLARVPHLDLLPLARRFWRKVLPDCTLATVERDVMGAARTGEDVPGAEVPARYLAYLQRQDTAGLHGVLEHNRTDIVALTALRSTIGGLLDSPQTAGSHQRLALGSWHERLGSHEHALGLYLELADELPDAAWRASLLLKRLRRWPEAVRLWEGLGAAGHAAAWIELAKYHEHRTGDFAAALAAVSAAREHTGNELPELDRRRDRLLRRHSAACT